MVKYKVMKWVVVPGGSLTFLSRWAATTWGGGMSSLSSDSLSIKDSIIQHWEIQLITPLILQKEFKIFLKKETHKVYIRML